MRIAIVTLCYTDKHIGRILNWKSKIKDNSSIDPTYFVYVDNIISEDTFSEKSVDRLKEQGIQVIKGRENRGTLLARYTAILKLYNIFDYVLMHDDDDLLVSNVLTTINRKIGTNGYDVVNFNFNKITDKNKFNEYLESDKIRPSIFNSIPSPFASDSVFNYNLVKDYSIWMSNEGLNIVKEVLGTARILSYEDELFVSCYSAYIHRTFNRNVNRLKVKKSICICDETESRVGRYDEEFGMYSNKIAEGFSEKLQKIYNKIIWEST